MGNRFVEMTWEEFEKHFKPIHNFLTEDEDNKMFETYGAEVEFVKSESPDRIWTYTQVEMGSAIYNGWHFVNRLGYFVTEIPAEEGVDYQIDFQPEVCDQCRRPFEEWESMDENGLCGNCSQDAEFVEEWMEEHKEA